MVTTFENCGRSLNVLFVRNPPSPPLNSFPTTTTTPNLSTLFTKSSSPLWVAGSVFPRTWQRDPKSLLLTSFFFLSLSHVGDGGYSVVVGEGDREGGVRGYDAGAIKN